MNRCDRLESCKFFQEAMTAMPAVADMMKKRYCYGDHESCARKMIFQALGKGYAPVDLAPNDVKRAQAIIDANS
jgi:uncharacterized membrane protein YkvA (DUF1232 family)